jgi:hypothetical protein
MPRQIVDDKGNVISEEPDDFDDDEHDYADDLEDEELSDEEIAGEECGRWINGRLGKYCSKAGTEECDWICPYSR